MSIPLPSVNNIPIFNKIKYNQQSLPEQNKSCRVEPNDYCYFPTVDVQIKTNEILQKIFGGDPCPLCR